MPPDWLCDVESSIPDCSSPLLQSRAPLLSSERKKESKSQGHRGRLVPPCSSPAPPRGQRGKTVPGCLLMASTLGRWHGGVRRLQLHQLLARGSICDCPSPICGDCRARDHLFADLFISSAAAEVLYFTPQAVSLFVGAKWSFPSYKRLCTTGHLKPVIFFRCIYFQQIIFAPFLR